MNASGKNEYKDSIISKLTAGIQLLCMTDAPPKWNLPTNSDGYEHHVEMAYVRNRICVRQASGVSGWAE